MIIINLLLVPSLFPPSPAEQEQGAVQMLIEWPLPLCTFSCQARAGRSSDAD